MGIESQALAVILVPLLGSLLIPLAGWARQRKATGWLAVLMIDEEFEMANFTREALRLVSE